MYGKELEARELPALSQPMRTSDHSDDKTSSCAIEDEMRLNESRREEEMMEVKEMKR